MTMTDYALHAERLSACAEQMQDTKLNSTDPNIQTLMFTQKGQILTERMTV